MRVAIFVGLRAQPLGDGLQGEVEGVSRAHRPRGGFQNVLAQTSSLKQSSKPAQATGSTSENKNF
jgi:hypothetical protein